MTMAIMRARQLCPQVARTSSLHLSAAVLSLPWRRSLRRYPQSSWCAVPQASHTCDHRLLAQQVLTSMDRAQSTPVTFCKNEGLHPASHDP